MHSLINTPFEQQLESWFQRLASRVAGTSLSSGHWVQTALEGLKEKKAALLGAVRSGRPEAQQVHLELAREAETLLLNVLSAEGPTPHLWLNQPLNRVKRFLEGQELPADTAGLFKVAFRRVHDQNLNPELEQTLRTLLLWSEGHTPLSGLELKAALARCLTDAEQAEQAEASSLETLLNEWFEQTTPDSEAALLEALAVWEDELFALEEQLASDDATQLEIMAGLFEAYSELHRAWESEVSEADCYSQMKVALAELRKEWQVVAAQVGALAELRAERPSEADYSHLSTLLEKSRDFQSGHISLVDLQSEVDAHQARWNQIQGDLKEALAGRTDLLTLVSSVEVSLATLAQVNSPCDARLSPICSLYVESLKALLRKSL